MSTDATAALLLRLHPTDDVAVARSAIAIGTALAGPDGPLQALDDIPAGHKIATRAVAAGDPVRKYGQVIGKAARDLAVGDHAHVHNVESARGRGDRVKA